MAHGRHSPEEENTTGMGLCVMESTKNLTWDAIGPGLRGEKEELAGPAGGLAPDSYGNL